MGPLSASNGTTPGGPLAPVRGLGPLRPGAVGRRRREGTRVVTHLPTSSRTQTSRRFLLRSNPACNMVYGASFGVGSDENLKLSPEEAPFITFSPDIFSASPVPSAIARGLLVLAVRQESRCRGPLAPVVDARSVQRGGESPVLPEEPSKVGASPRHRVPCT